MSKKCVVDVDLADVWVDASRKRLLRTLAWGDEVTVLVEASSHIEIELPVFLQ